jgi:hypothetical protein
MLPHLPLANSGLRVEGVDPRELRFFSPDYRSVMSLAVPTGYRISRTGDRPLSCVVEFDERLLAFGDVVVVQAGGETRGLELKAVKSGKRRSGLGFTIPPAIGDADVLAIALPVRFRDLYPLDHPGAVVPLRLHVDDGRARATSQSDPVAVATGVRPWAVEASARWQTVESAGTHGSYPQVVTLLSAGPAPTPAGTRLTVTADSRFLRTAGVVTTLIDPATTGTGDAARTRTYSVTESGVGGVRVVDVVLDDPLAAGESATISLSGELTPDGASVTWAATSVAVLAPDDAPVRREAPQPDLVRPFQKTGA